MANYTYPELEQLWISNGGPPEWAPTMAAVALAESNGDPNAKNPSGATGLWQTLMSAQGKPFQEKYGNVNLTDPNEAAKIAIIQLAGGQGISNWTADPVGKYVYDNGSKPLSSSEAQSMASNPSSVTTTTTDPTVSGVPTTFAPVPAGTDLHNVGGFDLSAIPPNEQGNAVKLIKEQEQRPGFAQELQTRIQQDFGYGNSWVQKIPELYGVYVWAALGGAGDPSTAAGKNLFQSAVSRTGWWQTTNANQRAWEQAQSTDPAGVRQALGNAQEKVLADANQIGVTLTKQELDNIAGMYAANSYVQSGSFGAQNGVAAEWLDQAIIDTISNKKAEFRGMQTDFSTAPQGTTDFAQQTHGGEGSVNLGGIAGQLYDKFQTVAQQYLMFNPNDPKSSLLTQQSLLNQVQNALMNYTGSGSSFGSSNLINGETARFTQLMKDQATKLYPSLAQAIAAGQTPADYVAPYQQLIGSQLGVTPTSINFTDPKWNWVIATPDPKTGQKQALSLDQVQQKLVTLPEWQKSNTAAQIGNDVVTGLNKAFGFGGS